MGCFDNYIGIEYCESDAPTSGKYLKDGGISLHELNMIAGTDYADGIQFGNEKINHAIALIENDLYAQFASKYKAKTIISNGRAGHVLDDMVVTSGTAQLRGVHLKFTQKSDFIRLYLKDIEFFGDFTGEIDFYVYDVKQNKLLDTFTMDAVADEVTSVDVNTYYKSGQKDLSIAILYDATGVNSYKTTIGLKGCAKCEINRFTNCDAFISAKGVYKSGTSVLENGLNGLGHTGGVSLNYSVECDHNAWICLFKQVLALPVIYKASSEIMTYAMYQSERTNFQTMDKEQMKERRDFYELQYREQMDAIIKNIDVPNDSNCFICTSKVRTRQLMP